jgi:hypothetical protein
LASHNYRQEEWAAHREQAIELECHGRDVT